jgi:probable DNA repair protein
VPDAQQRIITAAAAGALVLTANKRLARHLMRACDARLQAAGKAVWKTPQIISFDGWLHRCLADLGEAWRLLEGFPALRLWEQLIEKESAGTELELLQLAATARKAQEAHQWSVAYGCQLEGFFLTEDQWVFLGWQKAYQQACRQHHWLDRADLPELIFAAIAKGRLRLPGEVLLIGFDQSTPELEGLRRVLEQTGGQLTELPTAAAHKVRLGRCPCPDRQREIVLAARWARGLLDQGAISIGIVVTDLQARRQEIERIFRQQIDPAADLGLQADELAFSFSLGAPLLEQGPIHAAVQILRAGFRLSIDQAGFLLRTPYLAGSQSEADRRAQLDSRLRSFRQQSFSLKVLSELAAREDRASGAAGIFSALRQAAEQRQSLLPGEWAGRFAQELQAVGWPGERSLSSREYQMIKAWQEKLLPALATLDRVSAPVPRSQALGLLQRLAGEIEFQSEAPVGPVQVVGLLESSGLVFDHLWVMGLNEENFPAPARPNPFLPIRLQVEKGMPHASADRELEFSRTVLQRLQAASRDSVFSYAERSGDCPLRPSPLIAALPLLQPQFAPPMDAVSRLAAGAPALLELFDSQGPPLGGERGEGGTAILKDQALCPFRAFAHHRLRAKAFELAQPGLDPLTRGNLLHKSLEYFWREVGTQQRLLELDPADRSELIKKQVARALADCIAGRGAAPDKLQAIEATRLEALIGEWLRAVEEQRTPFAVGALEEEHFEQIGPLRIRTIIDRIDQLADGSRVILDYKTGRIKADSLLAARLLEPQLPIYAIAGLAAAADGVAFAQVRAGDCKLIGIAREAGLLPKVPGVAESRPAQELGLSDWAQLLDHWRRQLEQLAGDFVAGQAAVDPVDIAIACRYCDLGGFCRIAEVRPEAVAAEENT